MLLMKRQVRPTRRSSCTARRSEEFNPEDEVILPKRDSMSKYVHHGCSSVLITESCRGTIRAFVMVIFGTFTLSMWSNWLVNQVLYDDRCFFWSTMCGFSLDQSAGHTSMRIVVHLRIYIKTWSFSLAPSTKKKSTNDCSWNLSEGDCRTSLWDMRGKWH